MCLKARQIGMSHTTAAAAVLWAVFLGETTTVISTDLDTAGEVLDMAFKHAKVLEKLGSKWARCRIRGHSILFDNGGRILARPSSSGGRGFSGNVFLDEFAYVENPNEVWDGAAAVALHGYSKIRVSSTPNGVGNEFHNLWTNPRAHKGWAQHKVGLKEARADGLDLSDEICWKMAKGDPRIFAQIFECSFLDTSEQYFPTQLVLDAVLEDTHVEMGEVYSGYDVGYENDLSVLITLKQTRDDRVWVQPVKAGKRIDWEVQQQNIFEAFYQDDIKRLCVDASGVGFGLVKALQKQLGTQKVEGITFSLQTKEELATDMYQAFAARMIKIPNDPELIKDILSIRRIITPAGRVTYDAPSTVDGHADRAWALALAIHSCTNKPGKRVMKGAGDFENTL